MLKESEFVKIRVTVPTEATERVRLALGEAGTGKIGNYDHCSFVYPIQGYFRPLVGSNPMIGKVGESETVKEEMVEVICHRDKVEEAIIALKKVHPYEEPAIDILPLLKIGD